MSFHPNQIEEKHVLSAVDSIESQKLELIPSTRWLVEINGKIYPPKEIMRAARYHYDNSDVWDYGGGPPTNKYLERLGFKIIDMNAEHDPFLDLIKKYKSHIRIEGLESEIYKWRLVEKFKGKPDLNSSNFETEIRSLNFGNLVYHNAVTAMRHMAEKKQDEYRNLLKILFDEELELSYRVSEFEVESQKLFNSLFPADNLSHHHDERTQSAFLTFKFPDKYTFYKNSYYKKLCDFLKIKTKSKGEKYVHYLKIVNDFSQDYIAHDKELLTQVHKNLPNDAYEDNKNLLLAQDIIYTVLEKDIKMDKNYWIYSPGENAQFWDEFYQNGIMGLGWDYLGDLSNYNSKEEIISKMQEVEETEGSKKNDASACDDFISKVKIGDIVIAKKGRSTLIGYGKVVSDYYYDNNRRTFQKLRKVEWKKKGEWNAGHKLVLKTLTDISNYPSELPEFKHYYERLLAIMDDKIKVSTKNKEAPLNTILYGPPGTGKTYKTKEIAVEIANPEFNLDLNLSDSDKRSKIVEEYDRLFETGQIVFTTFHQSFSYEDFIEGIKPIPPKPDGEIGYEVMDGIFKKFCLKASEGKKSFNFDEAYEKYVEDVIESGTIELETPVQKRKFNVRINSNETSVAFPQTEKATEMGVTKEMLRDYIINGVVRDWKPYTTSIGSYLVSNYGIEVETIDNSRKNHVMVIDEINRGNVSAILGELITLLEPDKRKNEPEEIIVELPYSKDHFSVPSNIYIIGTMNTADRSVEALDTALRRRFSFTEIMPVPELLEEIQFKKFNLCEVLSTIDERIEALLDRDHTIGHSYFIKINSGDTLELTQAFENKVIPLLQEYFYHDYEKIALILGEGFIKHKQSTVKFANFKNLEQPELNGSFELKAIDDIEDAIMILLNNKDEE
tara:strand:+ start:25563 stop:28250 length:2688 start_codon:yes stop_codon:yes gene_type:complete